MIRPKRASARFIPKGFSQDRQPAEASGEKEARSPLKRLVSPHYPAVNGWSRNPAGKPHECGCKALIAFSSSGRIWLRPKAHRDFGPNHFVAISGVEVIMERQVRTKARAGMPANRPHGCGRSDHGSTNSQLPKLWRGDFFRLAAMPLLRVEACYGRLPIVLWHDVHWE